MARNIARYTVTFGLRGCYIPDSVSGPFEAATRKALADDIREYLRVYDLPASLFREVKIRRLWAFIKRHGSSTAHFGLHHGANALEFHGLTEEEFNAASEEE